AWEIYSINRLQVWSKYDSCVTAAPRNRAIAVSNNWLSFQSDLTRLPQRASDQAALIPRRANEIAEKRMRVERTRLEFRMILHPDEPWMLGQFQGLRQFSIRRHAGEAYAHRFQSILVVDVDFVSMPVAFGNLRRAVDFGYLAALRQVRGICSQ